MNLCKDCIFHKTDSSEEFFCTRKPLYIDPVDGHAVYETCKEQRTYEPLFILWFGGYCGPKGRFFVKK